MSGLIPLMLRPSSSSFPVAISIDTAIPPTNQTHPSSNRLVARRGRSPPKRFSLDPVPESPSSPASPATNADTTTNTKANIPKLGRSEKRSLALPRQATQIVSPLSVLPLSQRDWTETIAEVKQQYLQGHYRACTKRCLEVLDSLKQPKTVQTVHRIYLHFYAASSMEVTAFTLTSLERKDLLYKALLHYKSAEKLIKQENKSVFSRFSAISASSCPSSTFSTSSSTSSISSSFSSSSSSSSPPRQHSPGASISSCASSISGFTAPSTPSSHTTGLFATGPVNILDSFPATPTTIKRPSWANVQGSESLDNGDHDPLVRADSPTLGMEELYIHTPMATTPVDTPFPPRRDSLAQNAGSTSLPAPSSTPSQPNDSPRRPPSLAISTTSISSSSSQSLSRLSSLLSDLLGQIVSHIASVKSELSRLENETQEDSLGLGGYRSSSPLSAVASCPSSPLSFYRSRSPVATSPVYRPGSRAEDIRSRIKQLRESGWQRRNFDPSRYEQLCNSVLAELR